MITYLLTIELLDYYDDITRCYILINYYDELLFTIMMNYYDAIIWGYILRIYDNNLQRWNIEW